MHIAKSTLDFYPQIEDAYPAGIDCYRAVNFLGKERFEIHNHLNNFEFNVIMWLY